MTVALRKGWCPGALRPMPAKDGLLVRLRLTGGILTATNALALADLAERCGSGLFDLSGRGNLQMRGVREDALARLQDGLLALGLLDADAEAEAVRNVIASPLAGLHDGLDIRPQVMALERRLADDARLHALPGKFGFLIDDGSRPGLASVDADVRFDWDGEGFVIGLGGTRDQATSIGACKPPELVGQAVLLASAFLTAAEKKSGARRMRDVSDAVAEACRASPSPAYGRRWPSRQRGSDEGPCHLCLDHPANGGSPHATRLRRATFSRERLPHAHKVAQRSAAPPPPLAGRGWGWGSRRASRSGDTHATTPTPGPSPQGGGDANDPLAEIRPEMCACRSRERETEGAHHIVGLRTFSFLPVFGLATPFGRLDAAMLRAAARFAESTSVGELRLTPWRVILVPGASWQASLSGFITDPADPRLAVAACVGTDGCSRGTTHTQQDAARLAQHLRLDPRDGIILHVSGCAKGCAKASPSPLTLVADNGRYGIVRDGRAGDPPFRRGLDLDGVRDALDTMTAT